MDEYKIAVVDDDAKIRAMLRRSLTYAGYKVIDAEDGLQGWEIVVKEKPQLVILDIMLPGMDGFDVCREIKKVLDVPILMLTARDDTKDKVKGLDCGADDYLVKPFALEELMARVRALLRRFHQNSEEFITFEDIKVNLDTHQVWRGEREIELTAKEFDLLIILMKNSRKVLTRERLMDTVWGYAYEGESNVLEVYIGYLRNKLEENGEARVIRTVRGVGYVLKE